MGPHLACFVANGEAGFKSTAVLKSGALRVRDLGVSPDRDLDCSGR